MMGLEPIAFETIDLEVIFSPKKAKDYKFELNCKSLINRSVLKHTRNNVFLYIFGFFSVKTLRI